MTQEWPDSQGRLTATCFEWVSESWVLYAISKLTGVVISFTNYLIKKVLISSIRNHRFQSISN